MGRLVRVALGVSTLLLACASNTTTLGAADLPAPSVSSTDPDAAEGASEPPALLIPPDAGAPNPVCHGYTWDPEPSTTPCEYLLPPRTNDDPRLDPKTWDPRMVGIYVIEGGKEWDWGPFVRSKEACGGADGWFYVIEEGRARTHFAICPKSCTSVVERGALLRLDATTYCEAE